MVLRGGEWEGRERVLSIDYKEKRKKEEVDNIKCYEYLLNLICASMHV